MKIQISKPLIGEEEIKAVTGVLKSGQLSQGKRVAEFEKRFAAFIGTKHAVAVSSGTTALHLALLAVGIKAGDEVITTPFSFIASANCALFCGATPVFVDIDPKTFNIDVEKIVAAITLKTKAIIPVHLYGQPADMKRILEIATEKNLKVIEDAAQAHGAEFKGAKVGSFGDVGCFSFYSTKNVTTGEGGMITTDDDKIAERLRLLREHGRRERYFHEILGFNFRMTDIAAAMGLVQLSKLAKINSARTKNAAVLSASLKNAKGLIVPKVEKGTKHCWHQYTIRVTKDFPLSRDELKEVLQKKGIETGVYYPLPIHKQEVYKNTHGHLVFPEAERATSEVLSLPVHPGVRVGDLKLIAKTIKGVVR